ncbi:class I SAM-dependent methyltransferase [Roseateles toxinivorans]|uniref:Methyltransferase family protein n=1 Tax=Roseateles toxinivorans TaxID=270368 RepID=A0A4R6QQ78_9BURK|nr:class I SAM-dependent methyltransferase [Roseateles toxinivorans]TDP71394.1 methyltransferase family protein [Roseateles toxinivorans]
MTPERPTSPSIKPSCTLIFPANHPDGLRYREEARERSEVVVLAASGPSAHGVQIEGQEVWALPFVHEAGFADALMALADRHNIARVYSPVAAAHGGLAQAIRECALPLRLLGRSPIAREVARCRNLMSRAESMAGFISSTAEGGQPLPLASIASVLQLADGIYGESNELKIAAMIAIFASSPEGDVVEIGSLVGRSAAVLAWLARRYDIGQVLAIDPWEPLAAQQHDSPQLVRTVLSDDWDFSLLPKDFAINLQSVGWGQLNYLQMRSIDGHAHYCRTGTVESPEFGQTRYCGKIAVLHIDGNHDYSAVASDTERWFPLLVPGGWLILDDYIWAHGNGPQRVGDALLAAQAHRIERAFVCGKALFVRLMP